MDYATVAYDSATGKQLWASRYRGPDSFNVAYSMAVSPDGRAVYVTGKSRGPASGFDYATVAYNAATGKRLWVKRYNGPGNGADYGRSLAVSPDGATVYVSGKSQGSNCGVEYATVAYDAATGAQLWASRYGVPLSVSHGSEASSVAVSPDGAAVYVTGTSDGGATSFDYATVAYNAATGAQLWASRYNGPPNSGDEAFKVAVSPNGATVYVTGESVGGTFTGFFDYATVAYDATTGKRRWVSRYNGPAGFGDAAYSLAVSPRGTAVYVTGGSSGGVARLHDYATVAYNATTGARLWVSRYNGPASSDDVAFAVAVGPAKGTVFVTGKSLTPPSDWHYATVAYHP